MPFPILVIEPDPMRKVFFRAALASAGYTAQTVTDATEAAERLRTRSFMLVLLGPSVESSVGARLGEGEGSPAVVKLATLPDCVVGERVRGSPPELPGILEALTRYLRFAPPRKPADSQAGEGLLEEWAEYERRSTE